MNLLKTAAIPLLIVLISGCAVQDKRSKDVEPEVSDKPETADIITSEEYGTPPELESRTTGATVTEEIPRKVRSYQEPTEKEQEAAEFEKNEQD